MRNDVIIIKKKGSENRSVAWSLDYTGHSHVKNYMYLITKTLLVIGACDNEKKLQIKHFADVRSENKHLYLIEFKKKHTLNLNKTCHICYCACLNCIHAFLCAVNSKAISLQIFYMT